MGRQNFTCSTPECMHWQDDEDGCQKGSITIEEHCCLDFEERQEMVCIVISKGTVESIYSSLPKGKIMVEVLDYDSAHGEPPEFESELAARESQIRTQYNKII